MSDIGKEQGINLALFLCAAAPTHPRSMKSVKRNRPRKTRLNFLDFCISEYLNVYQVKKKSDLQKYKPPALSSAYNYSLLGRGYRIERSDLEDFAKNFR
jgi:hypothetical protein